jgi:hypothetical protein
MLIFTNNNNIFFELQRAYLLNEKETISLCAGFGQF